MLHLYLASLTLLTSPLPGRGSTGTATAESRSKEVIKVYPTPHEEGCLTVCSATDAAIEFYLFDSEGKLIYQSQMKHREQQTIQGLLPGAYTYHAFRADEKLKGGIVAVKN